MPEDKQQGQRTLGNPDITVRYRNRQDLVRQAIDIASMRADDQGSPDGQIILPVGSFRMVVEAFRLTYKTLGETIHQDLSGTSSAMPYGSSDQGAGPEVIPERANARALVRFNAIKPRAQEAMSQAQQFSEFNESAFRRGDDIVVPAEAFQNISAALIESNQLMTEVLSDDQMLSEMNGVFGRPPDRGDYSENYNFYNTGDWFRD
jgi:hypothetical protein